MCIYLVLVSIYASKNHYFYLIVPDCKFDYGNKNIGATTGPSKLGYARGTELSLFAKLVRDFFVDVELFALRHVLGLVETGCRFVAATAAS